MEKIYKALCAIACSITLNTTAMEQNTNSSAQSNASSIRFWSGMFLAGWASCDFFEAKHLTREVQEHRSVPVPDLMHAWESAKWLRDNKQRLSMIKIRGRCTGSLGVGLLAWELFSLMKQDTQSGHHA